MCTFKVLTESLGLKFYICKQIIVGEREEAEESLSVVSDSLRSHGL